MTEHNLETNIREYLIGEAQQNALDFVSFLSENDVVFERCSGYWENKLYFSITYNNENVCYVLFYSPASADDSTEPWVVWSDDSDSRWLGDSSAVDEYTKQIIWSHLIICDKSQKCFDGCLKGTKTIFGREFNNVCGTVMKFNNPTSVDVECMKRMVELRIRDIQHYDKT